MVPLLWLHDEEARVTSPMHTCRWWDEKKFNLDNSIVSLQDPTWRGRGVSVAILDWRSWIMKTISVFFRIISFLNRS